MKLWTVQSNEAYQKLQRDGMLSGDRTLIMEESFLTAYQWLCRQMEKRIGPPPHPDVFPVWAWHTWEGGSGKPDMRRYRSEVEAPDGCWRLTLEVPDDQVLLSDFDLWHFPLNGWYLALSEKEYRTSSADYKEKSWERIFQLDLPANDWCVSEKKSIQATFWTLTWDMVKKAEHFERASVK